MAAIKDLFGIPEIYTDLNFHFAQRFQLTLTILLITFKLFKQGITVKIL